MKYIEVGYVREKILATIKKIESLEPEEILTRLKEDIKSIDAHGVHILNPTKSQSDKERRKGSRHE